MKTISTTLKMCFAALFLFASLVMQAQKYEAEDATLSAGLVNEAYPDGFSGTGAVKNYNGEGGAITFSVTVATAGVYSVNLGYAAVDYTTSERRISIDVNGAGNFQTKFSPVDANYAEKEELLTLTAGVNTIAYTVKAGDNGWLRIDYLRVGAKTYLSKYEAEYATLSAGLINDAWPYGFSGTGAVKNFDAEGSAITFAVNVETAGVYSVYLGYAAPDWTTSPRQLSIDVNGTGNFKTNFTPMDANYAEKVESLTLNAGDNTIAYTAKAGDNAYLRIDYIRLVLETPTKAPSSTIEGVKVYTQAGQIVADLSAVNGSSVVSIIDAKGAVVKSVNNDNGLVSISVANQGIYLVRIQNGAKNFTQKVVIF